MLPDEEQNKTINEPVYTGAQSGAVPATQIENDWSFEQTIARQERMINLLAEQQNLVLYCLRWLETLKEKSPKMKTPGKVLGWRVLLLSSYKK